MKNHCLKLIGFCAMAFAMTVTAAEAQPSTAPVAAVAKSADGLTLLNGSINPNAQVYYYLQSASWCGPCRMAMPGIVETYKAMKADGRAEIILVNYDQTPEAGKAYVQSYETAMPTVHAADGKLSSLLGFSRARGIPFVIAVDADGKVLEKGAASRIHDWKKYVK